MYLLCDLNYMRVKCYEMVEQRIQVEVIYNLMLEDDLNFNLDFFLVVKLRWGLQYVGVKELVFYYLLGELESG